MLGDSVTMLAAVIIVIIAAIAAFAMRLISESRKEAKKRQATDFLDADGVGACGICFGDLGDGTVRCTCGRLFHRECAESTGACPYCGGSAFEEVDDVRSRCPNCGRYVTGRKCRCGAVLMRDGFFVCSCGAKMGAGETVCPECGAEYVEGRKG